MKLYISTFILLLSFSSFVRCDVEITREIISDTTQTEVPVTISNQSFILEHKESLVLTKETTNTITQCFPSTLPSIDACGGKCTDRQVCHQGENEQYYCTCKPGYRVGPNKECIQVDWCGLQDKPCGEHERCHNLQSTYECICADGYFRNQLHKCEISNFPIVVPTPDEPSATYFRLVGPVYTEISPAEARNYHDPGYQILKSGARAITTVTSDGISSQLRQGIPNRYVIEYHAIDDNGVRFEKQTRTIVVVPGKPLGPAKFDLEPLRRPYLLQCENYTEPGWRIHKEGHDIDFVVNSVIPEGLIGTHLLTIGDFTIHYYLVENGTNYKYDKVYDSKIRDVKVIAINPCIEPIGSPCRHRCNERAICEYRPDGLYETAPPFRDATYRCRCPPCYEPAFDNSDQMIHCKEVPMDHRVEMKLFGNEVVKLRACKCCSAIQIIDLYSEEKYGGYEAIVIEGCTNRRRNITDLVRSTEIKSDDLETNLNSTTRIKYWVNHEGKEYVVYRTVIFEVEDVHEDILKVREMFNAKFGILDFFATILKYLFYVALIILAVVVIPKFFKILGVFYLVYVSNEKINFQDFVDAHDMWYMVTRPHWNRREREMRAHQDFQLRYHDH